nr:armadillo repeat-containing protein LFR [Tanacetum cinerariifolium]
MYIKVINVKLLVFAVVCCSSRVLSTLVSDIVGFHSTIDKLSVQAKKVRMEGDLEKVLCAIINFCSSYGSKGSASVTDASMQKESAKSQPSEWWLAEDG